MNFSRQSISFKSIDEANSAPPIKLFSNEINKKFFDTLYYSLVIFDYVDSNPIFIQSHL
jgi:hypothetical protein